MHKISCKVGCAEATTAAQFELLVSEMEKHPEVARGMPNFGSSKASVENVWEATSKLLNAIGPPIRTSAKWRKVWTDYRGRLKKKLSNNKKSIRQTGGGPSEVSELTPIELAVDSIVSINVAANPSGTFYGVKIANEPHNTVLASSPPSVIPSNDCPELPDVSCSPPAENAPTVEENILNIIETPPQPQCSTHKQTFSLKKRRQMAKDDERKKLIKLTQEHTEAITRQTAALEKLTTAIEIQNRLLQEKN
ncbi:uncharacterized protein LOC135961216 [Calliphora vicina]|uniref:uncharacterized protein LOC135961216 n=1 Tax=Calliphora vicina TaxID=7373 RepID=UPI00325A536D